MKRSKRAEAKPSSQTHPEPETSRNGSDAAATAPSKQSRKLQAEAVSVRAGDDPTEEGISDTFDKRLVLKALIAARDGDFSSRLPSEWTGLDGKIADSFNEIMLANQTMERELDRVSTVVGKQGKIRQRVSFTARPGAWRGMEQSV